MVLLLFFASLDVTLSLSPAHNKWPCCCYNCVVVTGPLFSGLVGPRLDTPLGQGAVQDNVQSVSAVPPWLQHSVTYRSPQAGRRRLANVSSAISSAITGSYYVGPLFGGSNYVGLLFLLGSAHSGWDNQYQCMYFWFKLFGSKFSDKVAQFRREPPHIVEVVQTNEAVVQSSAVQSQPVQLQAVLPHLVLMQGLVPVSVHARRDDDVESIGQQREASVMVSVPVQRFCGSNFLSFIIKRAFLMRQLGQDERWVGQLWFKFRPIGCFHQEKSFPLLQFGQFGYS